MYVTRIWDTIYMVDSKIQREKVKNDYICDLNSLVSGKLAGGTISKRTLRVSFREYPQTCKSFLLILGELVLDRQTYYRLRNLHRPKLTNSAAGTGVLVESICASEA